VADLSEDDAEEPGLSDAERVAINNLIEQTLTAQPAISNEAMLGLVTGIGIQLADRVKRPLAVIGTMLYHARRRRGIPQPTSVSELPGQSAAPHVQQAPEPAPMPSAAPPQEATPTTVPPDTPTPVAT
jgi:hypothetical protein